MHTLPAINHRKFSAPLAAASTFKMRCGTFALILLVLSSTLHAQETQAPVTAPPAGSNWGSVKALPTDTKVHITTDHGGKTCRIFAVSDDTLTCAKGSNAAGAVLQRGEIKHIKLAHHVRSTLVGAGIGAGGGALGGAIAGRTTPCPPTGFCFNGILGPGAVAAVFGVGGAIVGSVIGGATDMARGSSIYTRP